MLSALVTALDDNDASVRRAACSAIASLRDRNALEPLRRRIEVEDSATVRVSLQKAINRLSSDEAADKSD
jgi:HEAT repeat protein